MELAAEIGEGAYSGILRGTRQVANRTKSPLCVWRAAGVHISCRSRRVTVAEDQSHGGWMNTSMGERVVWCLRVAELVASDCCKSFEVDGKRAHLPFPSALMAIDGADLCP